MQQYDLTLVDEKVKSYKRIGWIIIFINIIILFYLSLFAANKLMASGSRATLILLALTFAVRYFLKRKKTRFLQVNIDVFFLFLMLGWIGTQQYWLSAVMGVFYVLSGITQRKFIASFSSEKIVYPSFPVKNIAWTELNIVILKDGLLTIDFKNDRIIQQSVDETITVTNEQEFNDFCRQQLANRGPLVGDRGSQIGDH